MLIPYVHRESNIMSSMGVADKRDDGKNNIKIWTVALLHSGDFNNINDDICQTEISWRILTLTPNKRLFIEKHDKQA